MRTGKPHVRSYTEEKDRNVMICVDQRSSMFFASQNTMKSVVAAEVAALCGWRLKEMIAVNIFPGDMLLKNFGVSKHKRIIFYDYDEVQQYRCGNDPRECGHAP